MPSTARSRFLRSVCEERADASRRAAVTDSTGARWRQEAASVSDPPYSPVVESIWIAVLGGTAGAALTALATIGLQIFLTRRAERRQDDKDRIAMVLEFTGRANAMVVWAAYVHAHAAKAAELATTPAILIRQFQPLDIRDMANSFVSHLTELVRAGGHLVANEGRQVQPCVQEVVDTTTKLVKGYLNPVESRPRYFKLFSPVPPVDLERQKDMQVRLASKSQELELLVLGRCSTMQGAELARPSSSGRAVGA